MIGQMAHNGSGLKHREARNYMLCRQDLGR